MTPPDAAPLPDTPPVAHNYIPNPKSPWSVKAMMYSAELAQENSGVRQWIHHHPHGHLCDHQCGPLPTTPEEH